VSHQPLHRFKAEFFRALGHPARLRILELLRPGEMTVSELQVALDIEASSVSQQLAVLRAKNIVDTRRVGTSVYYSVRDPQIFQLLDVAREIFNNHLIDLQSMLELPPVAGEQPSNGKLARAADEVTPSARQRPAPPSRRARPLPALGPINPGSTSK
jgi:ArsR family transcriptional regulator